MDGIICGLQRPAVYAIQPLYRYIVMKFNPITKGNISNIDGPFRVHVGYDDHRFIAPIRMCSLPGRSFCPEQN
jgi:hypothetical protein